MPRLSLTIPCYNEAKNLPLLVERCRRLVAADDIEVVLVDNGSTDDSARVLAELLRNNDGCRSVRVQVNGGYGLGILAGLRASAGDVLAWTHADLQTDPMDAVAALASYEQHGPDAFVKGQRSGRPLGDRLFTIGMSVFETVLLGTSLNDINAQPTMFSRRFFETWTAAPHDFSLDLYAYFMAKRAGLTVHRIPVRFGERAHGVSHWNVNWAAKRRFIRRTVDYSLALKRDLAGRR